MTKKTGKFVALFIGVLVIITGGYYLIGGIGEPSGSQSFELPVPDDFIGERDDGFNILAGVNCKIKQTLNVYDGANKVIFTKDSDLLEGNPLISNSLFTRGDTGKGISHFTVEPKIWCDAQADYLELQLTPSQLTLTVAVSDDNGNMITTYQKTQDIATTTFRTGGNPEKVMTAFGVGESQVSDVLVDWKSFNSRVDFITTGFIGAKLFNHPEYRYFMPIASEDIRIQYSVTQYQDVFPDNCPAQTEFDFDLGYCVTILDGDSDGDGVLDSVDQCPTSAENYNGYQDNDGCIDVKPPVDEPCSSDPQCVDDPPPTQFQTCANGDVIPTSDECGVEEPIPCPATHEPNDENNACVPKDGVTLPPVDDETEEMVNAGLNSGAFDTAYTLNFADQTTRTVVASTIAPDVLSQLTLSSLVASVDDQPKKQIASVQVDAFYRFFSLSEAQKTTATGVDLETGLTMRVNGQNLDLPSSNLQSSFSRTGGDLKAKTGQDNYYGIHLGSKIYSASDLESFAVNQGGVKPTHTEDLTLTFEFNGSFDVTRSGFDKTLTINGHKVTFTEFTLTIPKEVGGLNCPDGFVEGVNSIGEPKCVEGCVGMCTPDDTKVCEDGTVILLSLSCPDNNHGDDPTQECDDGTEIPIEDECDDGSVQKKVCGNGTTVLKGDSCPVGTYNQVINGQICTFNNVDDKLISCQSNPTPTPTPTPTPIPIIGGLDQTTMILIGAVILIVGIVAIIAKRR